MCLIICTIQLHDKIVWVRLRSIICLHCVTFNNHIFLSGCSSVILHGHLLSMKDYWIFKFIMFLIIRHEKIPGIGNVLQWNWVIMWTLNISRHCLSELYFIVDNILTWNFPIKPTLSEHKKTMKNCRKENFELFI